ncbi:Sensor-like histidine kinase RcsD [Serratia marcescens]|nr:Sensor-like histidine kinase RcsD [Serratia marcescens]CAI0951277.1 Sensor-like histidine kinase RcsD [Serratia marcescens]CAI1559570.1 Sensor-like histidine kinase RcsD [Serratia marcescens]CAI1820005.1 Sensor-like histidine kinase RcsD [Serratia marcescens]
MQNKQLTISSSNITRCFLLFIVLLTIGIGLYGYNYTNAWLAEKKYTLNSIAGSLQKRIDAYRYMTYQVYDKFGNAPAQNVDPGLQETRLRPDVYYVEKPHKKTDAVIFGSHDENTLAMIANISDYLDTRWGAKTENYAMYYLNGQDNSLSLITTQPLKELASRFRESYLTTSADERRAEMLQQANMLDERESFSDLRKQRFQNAYSFSIRTTFNQPGHLATVIAFDLPINDIIPANLARANFLLLPDDVDLDDSAIPAETVLGTHATMSGGWVEFSAALPNAPLKVMYRVSAINLAIDLLRNNIWLIAVNLLLLALSMLSIYFIRRQYIRPSENMAVELEAERALNQEIVSSLPSGLLVYSFANNTVIASNKIAEHLLPHLSLQKIAHMAEQHHGVIQATVNNEVYEIRIFRSQLSPDTYLFLMHDQDKEVMVNKRLQQARREYDKNVQARKLMLHNLGIELNQPVRQMHDLVDRLHSRPDEEQQQALLGQLTAASASVLELIDNITLLTRLETQDWQPTREPFNPTAMIDELLLEALPALNQKGLALFKHFQLDDLSMPGDKYGDGITLIKYIKRHYPQLSIIVLTMNNNPAILSAVLDLDIEGIVLKQGAPTDLPKALAALQKGKKFTPESVSKLLEKISASGYGDKRLSPKESEVLRLFAEGFLVTEIAKKLNRSIKTISSQKKSAMMKLGVENDIALLNYLSSVSMTPLDKD